MQATPFNAKPVVNVARSSGESDSAGARIAVSSLTHTYRGPSGPLRVVDHVSFEVPSGGYLALTGPSGAGKSTLLSLIGGLERPQEGELLVGSDRLIKMSRRSSLHTTDQTLSGSSSSTSAFSSRSLHQRTSSWRAVSAVPPGAADGRSPRNFSTRSDSSIVKTTNHCIYREASVSASPSLVRWRTPHHLYSPTNPQETSMSARQESLSIFSNELCKSVAPP